MALRGLLELATGRLYLKEGSHQNERASIQIITLLKHRVLQQDIISNRFLFHLTLKLSKNGDSHLDTSITAHETQFCRSYPQRRLFLFESIGGSFRLRAFVLAGGWIRAVFLPTTPNSHQSFVNVIEKISSPKPNWIDKNIRLLTMHDSFRIKVVANTRGFASIG